MMEQLSKQCPPSVKAKAFTKIEIRKFLGLVDISCRYQLVRGAFAAMAINGCNRIAEIFKLIITGK